MPLHSIIKAVVGLGYSGGKLNFVATITFIMSSTIIDTYRLNSLEEPTDTQLEAVMQEVGAAGRETMLLAEREFRRRLMAIGQHTTKETDNQ